MVSGDANWVRAATRCALHSASGGCNRESNRRHLVGRNHGAQGRDRTTDTAIFSRMLYQLSYLGVPATEQQPEGAAVYSQAGPLCPPRFAAAGRLVRFRREKAAPDHTKRRGRPHKPLKNRRNLPKRLTPPRRPHPSCRELRMRPIASDWVDVLAAFRTEEPVCLDRRLTADRTRPGAVLVCWSAGGPSRHSTSRSGSGNPRRPEA